MSIKYSLVVLAATTILAQPVFADDEMNGLDHNKSCAGIVKSCLTAGYRRGTPGKQFWKNCMNPLLLGKSVTGISISPEDVKTCRAAKIKQLEEELDQLKKAP
jgi:hypothetical protein